MIKIYPQADTREKILETATECFCNKGIHISVDEIVAKTGFTKMTLYKHFPSKDHLILEVLERMETKWWQSFETLLKQRNSSPLKQLLAIFDMIPQHFCQQNDLGIPCNNANVQIADSLYPINLVTANFRKHLYNY